MSRYYTIDEDHVVSGPFPFEGWIEWAKRVENLLEFERVCRVGRNQIDSDCYVSTIFLRGIDHSFLDQDRPDHMPLLFETMIFGGPHDRELWRYATWDEAALGHQAAVALALGEPVT